LIEISITALHWVYLLVLPFILVSLNGIKDNKMFIDKDKKADFSSWVYIVSLKIEPLGSGLGFNH
jgi:hypothetical protein